MKQNVGGSVQAEVSEVHFAQRRQLALSLQM